MTLSLSPVRTVVRKDGLSQSAQQTRSGDSNIIGDFILPPKPDPSSQESCELGKAVPKGLRGCELAFAPDTAVTV